MINIKDILLTLLFIWLIGFCYYVYLINSYPINTNATDVIVVFSKGRQPLDKGVSLLKAKYAPLLFINGVRDKTQFNNFLKENSIKPEQVRLSLGEYDNIKQYAISTANLVCMYNISSLRLVANKYNMPLVLSELKSLLPSNTIIIPHPLRLKANEHINVFLSYNHYIYYLIIKYLTNYL